MVKNLIRQKLEGKFPGVDFDILTPPDDKMGDYSTNVAFALAKKGNRNPFDVGEEFAASLKGDKELVDIFYKIEVVKPGFINFHLSDDFLREQMINIIEDKDYGLNKTMKGKTVMVEYTDPNPFKLFHIGHLMSNAIGEAIARLYESSGAKVLRVTWQGDVGMHIAMAVWAIKIGKADTLPSDDVSLEEKMNYLGKAYAIGATAYKEGTDSMKREIEEVNKSIYKKDGDEVDRIHNTGRQWSLDYFEETYKRLGSKFDHYFFESELGQKGLEIVRQHPEVFEESEGAVVFRGEKYGLHTRVFINSSGLPVYESKELGLNKEKFELYNPDLSIIITGNEINDYFKVLLKVMELVIPEVAARTEHISHGMLRLPDGKMSSRTGDVITADSLIEQTKSRLPESESEEVREKIAIGAIKYSILKQSPGHDIIFDFDKSLSVKGDSGPYLQYTYARLLSILRKAERENYELPGLDLSRVGRGGRITNYELLGHETELKLMKRLLEFPDAIEKCAEQNALNGLALYLYELSNEANRFYEIVHILSDKNFERRNARLMLVNTVAAVIRRGLKILGIETLERI
ncbi:MAG: arginine--tRNA ligase [Candidatus Yanofskybacteria bacterium]|nr:arginine--tRNA ligase [Candidatus Yanofskybacteria bacterium]